MANSITRGAHALNYFITGTATAEHPQEQAHIFKRAYCHTRNHFKSGGEETTLFAGTGTSGENGELNNNEGHAVTTSGQRSNFHISDKIPATSLATKQFSTGLTLDGKGADKKTLRLLRDHRAKSRRARLKAGLRAIRKDIAKAVGHRFLPVRVFSGRRARPAPPTPGGHTPSRHGWVHACRWCSPAVPTRRMPAWRRRRWACSPPAEYASGSGSVTRVRVSAWRAGSR